MQKSIRQFLLILIVACVMWFPGVIDAQSSIVVQNTNDSGSGSLREAINTANSNPDTTTIFIPAGTYTLQSQLPVITTNVTLRGAGRDSTFIEANAAPATATYRVLELGSGVTVILTGATIQHGNVMSSTNLQPGAGIYNNGASLTLGNVRLKENRTYNRGGGVYNDGTLTLNNVLFEGNLAQRGSGGAIYVGIGQTMTGSNVIFQDNVSNFGGGAIDNDEGSITLNQVQFINNSARDIGIGGIALIQGGAILNRINSDITINSAYFSGNFVTGDGGGGVIAMAGEATFRKTTFEGNYAAFGGAVENCSFGNGGTLTIENSTFYDNRALDINGNGGAICNAGTLTLTNTTIAFTNDNISGSIASALDNSSNGTATLRHVVITESVNGVDCSNNGTVNTSNEVWIEDGSCTFADYSGDPQLDVLADNGGYAQTLMPAATSGLLDVTPSCPLVTDQRGVNRPQGSGCDIGAVERVTGADYDINDDGLITPVDVIYVVNRLGTTNSAIDFDNDGTVDSDDVQEILGFIGQPYFAP